MPAIPMPDPDTEATLDAARSQAAAGLKGRFPDSMLAPPPPAPPKVSNSVTNSVGLNAQAPALPPPEPGPDSQPVSEAPPPEPTPDAVPVQDDNTMGRALKESSKQLGGEIGNGLMRAAAATARTLGFAASGVNNLLSSGPDDQGAHDRDATIFNFIRDHVDPAYEYWKQDPNNTNPYAKFAGDTAEGVAPMMLGPAGLPAMVGNAVTEAGKDSVDAGDNTKTAVALATIAGLTTTAQLGVGFKDPNVAKRIAKWVGAGDAIDEAGKGAQILVRHILNNESYKDAIAKVDPANLTSLGVNSVMQAIFGILHTPDGQKLVKKADPKGDAPPDSAVPVQAPDLSADDQSTPPPPPPPAPPLTTAGPESPVSTGPLPGAPAAAPVADTTGFLGAFGSLKGGGTTADLVDKMWTAYQKGSPEAVRGIKDPALVKALRTPGMDRDTFERFVRSDGKDAPAPPAAPAVADKPSPEPVSDLNAQWKDMNDSKTPRTGVLIPKGVDDDSMTKRVGQAAKQNRVLTLDQGTLVLKSKKLADDARAQLAAGVDPQQVIGKATGAGDGKSPEKTAVVQGHDDQGNVAAETTVAPADVPAASAAMVDQGKTPVVTTPAAAVARRADLVAGEAGPGENAVPVQDAADQSRASPSATQPTSEGVGSATSESGLPKTGDRHIIKIAGEDVPVVIATDPVGNKVGVHTIDDDGRVSKDVRQVPLEMFKKAEPEPAPERRQDTGTRKKISEMSLEDAQNALSKHELTGIPNKRAFDEADKKPAVASVDVDGLGWVNNFGHEAGDAYLKAFAKAMHEVGGDDAFHKSGDEFIMQADDHGQLADRMQQVHDRLKDAVLTFTHPDGRVVTLKGIGFSHGVGDTYEAADRNLDAAKGERQAQGLRATKGGQPPNASVETPGARLQADEGGAPAQSELGKARDLYNQENTPEPGKKFAGSVKEHAQRVAGLARAVLEHLKTAKDIPENVRKHAQDAANAVARVDAKSDEALSKGQGVSHSALDARAADLMQAIHNIEHLDDVKIPDKVQTKADALKKRLAKAKEAEAKAEAPAPTVEPGGAADRLAKAITSWQQNHSDIKLRYTAEGTEVRLGSSDDVLAVLPKGDEGTQESVSRALLKSLKKAYDAEGRTFPTDPHKMTRAEFGIAYRAGAFPDVEIDNLDAVKDSGNGLQVDTDKLYDQMMKGSKPESNETVETDALKKRLDKAKEVATDTAKETVAEKVKAKQAEKVSSGIKDVEDATKPKTLNAGERTKIGNALKRYLEVSDEDLPHAHDNLERIVRDVYGEDRAAEGNQIIELARDQRADANEKAVPKRMSDTLDDEDERYDGHEHDAHNDYDHLNEPNELRTQEQLDKIAKDDHDRLEKSPLGRLTNRLQETGFWKQLHAARETGRFLSTHKVLNHLMSVAKDDPVMTALLSKLREHAPDLPIRPVDKIIHPETGQVYAAAGLFHKRTNSLQVQISNGSKFDVGSKNNVHAIIHEITHAATSYELHNNPVGKFANEIAGLLNEARSRAEAMGQRNDHYGLTDPHEFVAETLTNPKFQQFLTDSEQFSLQDKTQGPLRGLFDRMAGSIAKMLGIKNPLEAKLLRDSMDAIQRGMEDQSRNNNLKGLRSADIIRQGDPDAFNRLRDQGNQLANDAKMPGLDDALHLLEEPPRALDHDDEFKAVTGPATTAVARKFRQVVRGGAVEAIRRTVRAFTPYDGLVRAALRRGVFGHDDGTNPLRHYDELTQQRNAVINRIAHEAEPIVNDQAKLSYTDNKKLGQFEIDSTLQGIDPRISAADTPKSVSGKKGFQAKYDAMQARWKNLTDAQRDLYGRKVDFNEKALRANKKAAVNVAIDAFSDKEISKAQRQLLYSVDSPAGYDALIGKGKEIDLGDHNDKLVDSLRDLASTFETDGPYLHLGRVGDHVVQVTPEGTRNFRDQASAEAYAEKIRALSPKSKAKVAQVGGQWQVDYEAHHVSFHNSPAEAEAEVERLRGQGYDVGTATHKILSQENAPLSSGMQEIVAEAGRRMNKYGSDEASKAAQESLTNAFVNLMAARSSYAGSKLARRGVGGVKPEEMARNFATHAQSMAWNTGHMSSVFKLGEAMGNLREAVKDPEQPQPQANQRGRVYDEMMRRSVQEQRQYGAHAPINSTLAKLGFLNYMTSVSHALIYLTQNFTTVLPVAMSRFGGIKATSALFDAMKMTSGPAFRETFRAALSTTRAFGTDLPGGKWIAGTGPAHNADTIQKAILEAVANHPRFGKWAEGGKDSPLQQLIDRGIIHTSLSNQMATVAKGGSPFVNRVMEWARVLPSMADIFNRVSTGVAALELHKGDVYKAGDFVRETHIDYSQDNKPRAYRALSKIPALNTITMFKSYVTGMAHLLYSHVYDGVAGEADGGRAQALKTVAGMIVGTSLFAGVQRGAGLEPIRAAMYAYKKLVGDNNEYYDFDNMSRRAIHDMVGSGKVADVLNHGLPALAGVDISTRLGLSDLFLHDPPDILSMDKGDFAKFGYSQLGPMFQELGDNVGYFNKAIATGRFDDFNKAIPFKLLHNVVDGYDAATKGKVAANGAQLTAPSLGAGIAHTLGLKPLQEAKIGANAATTSDYKVQTEARKYKLVQAWAKTDPAERADFFKNKVLPFNQANPGHRVTRSDLVKQMRSINNTQRQAQGLPVRDPVQNELNDD